MMPTLDPTGHHCDLCGAARWKIILVAVDPRALPPRVRQALTAQLQAAPLAPNQDALYALTIPLCRPCAELLDATTLPHHDRVEDLTPAAMAQAVDTAQPATANAEHVLAGLLERYERELA